MKNIILTGLMGAGKSAVSKVLKEIFTDFELVETDNLIEKSEGLKVSEIFEKYGEEYFREKEKETLQTLLIKKKQIISLGGGTLENNPDWNLIRKNSITFYLKASVETLYKRLLNDNTRPLLKCDNPKEKLKELLNIRDKNYSKADYTIIVDNLSIKETAKTIERIYKNGANS